MASENPFRISPPNKKIDTNANNVVTEVIKVLDKVSLIEILVKLRVSQKTILKDENN